MQPAQVAPRRAHAQCATMPATTMVAGTSRQIAGVLAMRSAPARTRGCNPGFPAPAPGRRGDKGSARVADRRTEALAAPASGNRVRRDEQHRAHQHAQQSHDRLGADNVTLPELIEHVSGDQARMCRILCNRDLNYGATGVSVELPTSALGRKRSFKSVCYFDPHDVQSWPCNALEVGNPCTKDARLIKLSCGVRFYYKSQSIRRPIAGY